MMDHVAMDIEGLLSSLSFDDEAQHSSLSSGECLPIMFSPYSESQFNDSTCFSRSSSSQVSGSMKSLGCNQMFLAKQHSYPGDSSSKQQNVKYQEQLLKLMQSSSSNSSGSSSSSNAGSQLSDTRFIPSRKHSKYGVMLSQAHEVKQVKSTKGQFAQNENDFSVAQLYMKHVLNIGNDENGSAKKLQFDQGKSSKIVARNRGECQNNPFLSEMKKNTETVLQDSKNNERFGNITSNGVEEMLRRMRSEAGLFQHEQQVQQRRGCENDGSGFENNTSSVSSSISQSIQKRQSKMYAYTQYKVLDAPGLIDDFYLNLLDWSQKNLMAVGLGSQVYVWNGFNNRVQKVCEMTGPHSAQETNKVQAIQWSTSGNLLGVGDSNGLLSIYDQVTSKQVQQIQLHSDRIGSLAWKDDNIVASGSRDKSILCTDIRVPMQSSYRCLQRYTGHKQEVCGLKWSFDSQSLASGGNDNKLFVWSLRTSNHINKFSEHKAGVKAIAWSPHQHSLLVSGGGTADRTIRFWNTSIGKQVECIDTNSQVCNLVFSKNENEFVSTHGFQENDIIVWKYPTLEKVACLTGHTCRVLQLGLSPCSTKIVTGAGDETLRFWDVFQHNKNTPEKRSSVLTASKFDLR